MVLNMGLAKNPDNRTITKLTAHPHHRYPADSRKSQPSNVAPNMGKAANTIPKRMRSKRNSAETCSFIKLDTEIRPKRPFPLYCFSFFSILA